MEHLKILKKDGLYDPDFERDSCGVGFIANIKGYKSHQILEEGITVLKNLVHRGALGGDLKTGDGAGVLIQIPHGLFVKKVEEYGFKLPLEGEYGVGMFFLPQDEDKRSKTIGIIEETVKKEGGTILGWRDVEVNPSGLGEIALNSMPYVRQAFIEFSGLKEGELERKFYITRRAIENEAFRRQITIEEFYVVSFSSRTIVYKGMFTAAQLEEFYPDLSDIEAQSAFILVHQRYSTNTFPSWPLAQPFRYIAHNGEINTLRGNINKMKARESNLSSPAFGDNIKKLFPIVNPGLSDSGVFDNVYELLLRGGRSLEHIMMMMIPEAFGTKYHISQDKRAFYEYHASLMEPWDGPAAMAFTDGVKVGAALDRNGLRPARYVITKNDKLILASETGVLDIPAGEILQKGRLAPGKMILVDTKKGRIIFDNEIKATISRQKPYRRWIENNRIELKGVFQPTAKKIVDKEEAQVRQIAFGYTLEDINKIIIPMVESAQEPVSSMGNDEALAVLSEKPRLLYDYFKQLFAQVTNPPIDPYRENMSMSLMSFIGREKNLMEETELHCRQLKLPHPILSNEDMEKIRSIDNQYIRSADIPITYEKGVSSIASRLEEICTLAESKIDEGCSIIILTDKNIGPENVPIPALLATSCVHQYLIRSGKRQLAGLVVETGEARDVMHFATLIGFGAGAVNPYLAFETIMYLKDDKKIKDSITLEQGIENYITSVKKGLLKIMSKMGISTIRSYKGAQIFEAIGINSETISKYFADTPSRIEGIGLEEISKEAEARNAKAYKLVDETSLDSGGSVHYRSDSEKHLITPKAVVLLQKAVREGDYSIFKEYSEHINDNGKNICTLRGLFKFKDAVPVPVEEVESEDVIVKRFVTSAMSFGSISKEAHETLAIAMNRLGCASNSGEGGEDEERYLKRPDGDSLNCKIKQVASARFGVTSYYLINAEELQIKMAQGAKPGEGGQLPGDKVDVEIARVRHSSPGITLISPPPHHDIYSIEDLAQLIFDLKNANPKAVISVKLVSEVGVGTIAAGVAKGRADKVLISGHDGGTGASPLSSIKSAGIPWEIGLAETQQTLLLNNLRSGVKIQADGKMKTGRDVVIAALLGAEEFGFGTIPLITLGCVMMRKCHLNTCPVGVATQNPELRKKFQGKPEYIINFMKFVARETREIMAGLGFRTMDEMIGRVETLEVNTAVEDWKSKGLDFSAILKKPNVALGTPLHFVKAKEISKDVSLDDELIEEARKSLDDGTPINLFASIRNSNRTVGATLSAEVSKRYRSKGLPEDTIRCKFTGSAGQSFGAFLAPGITLELEGDANDYLGKGMSGGKIIVYPLKGSAFRSQNNIIAGNVNLFGATSGEAYISGMVGERFAVRNSGAVAVVEGVGDHCCEYMTGGIVVVLGETGINFAAGMSGGVAYVLDEDQLFDTKCNLEMADIEPILEDSERDKLYNLIKKHVEYTASEYAARILKDWNVMAPQFVKVIPIEYKRVLDRLKKQEAKETETVSITEEVFK